MRRKIFDKLLEWKNSYVKPLILTGASGVGKSYSAYNFGKSFYQYFIYINASTDNTVLTSVLHCNSTEYIENLKTLYHIPSEYDEELLIIFDELDLNKDKLALNVVMDYLKENKKYHLLMITNYLEEFTKDFQYLFLHPLDFEEFLLATGNEWYIESIKVHYESNKKLPDIVHNELLTIFHLYLTIGGMPLAVNEYIGTEGSFNINSQHRILLYSYLHHLGKSKEDVDSLKIRQVIDTIPSQLQKENHKFRYSIIRKGATQSMYSNALQYIKNSFYGVFCVKIDENDINTSGILNLTYLEHMINMKNFDLGLKIYQMDIGLLNSNFNPNIKGKEINSKEEELMTKALFENYVALSLAASEYPLLFWESNSQSKMDFIIAKKNKLIPIEIKTSNNTRSKNFSVMKQMYPFIEEQIKISTKNFDYQNHVKYVPIYATFCI